MPPRFLSRFAVSLPSVLINTFVCVLAMEAHSSKATTAINFAVPDEQAKFDASSVLPWPLYFATSGYGHRGRVRATPLAGTPCILNLVAMIASGMPEPSSRKP